MGLKEYQRKRHFSRTPEPAGKVRAKSGRSFVVQKHRASHLHYDFRLELDGVLKSWAVPKGPSLDPSVKRLAMQVEDHPVEYGSFEGIIPAGEYGGGTVMLWDRGKWEPAGDPREGYRRGRLKFRLDGEKLHGGWMLVRTNRPDRNGDTRQWLLFKERDEAARAQDDYDVADEKTESVASGRTMEEIAADRDQVWSSKIRRNGRTTKPVSRGTKRKKKSPPSARTLNSNGDYDFGKEELDGVRLTSPEKVLYPEQGVTKLELATYYRDIGDWILPHIADRPLVLVRCPEGRAKECFFQKHPRVGTPEWLRQIPIREESKTEPYVVVDDVKGMISLAQIGSLEIHAWGSRADMLERPDRLIFDLDPAEDVAWKRVVQSAKQIRGFLQELGLESFVKTTGGKGLHLVLPIDRRHTWDEAKAFCKHVADLIVTADPSHYTANMAKAARPGKIFIDYLRNGRGATAIVPYSTRARPGAPISVPLRWEELSPRIRGDHYTIRNILKRLSTLKQDPWEAMAGIRQGLSGPMKELQSLTR